MKSFSLKAIFSISILLFSIQIVFAQEQFKNLEIVLVNENTRGTIVYFDYTTNDKNNIFKRRDDIYRKVEEEINYKLRMAQLKTERDPLKFPVGHVMLNFYGEIYKLSDNIFFHSGTLEIQQFLRPLESDERIFTTTWSTNFSKPSNNGFEASQAFVDDMKEACDDFLKEYFEVN